MSLPCLLRVSHVLFHSILSVSCGMEVLGDTGICWVWSFLSSPVSLLIVWQVRLMAQILACLTIALTPNFAPSSPHARSPQHPDAAIKPYCVSLFWRQLCVARTFVEINRYYLTKVSVTK